MSIHLTPDEIRMRDLQNKFIREEREKKNRKETSDDLKRYVKEDNIKENILKFNNEDMKGIAKFEEKREFVNRVKKELIENAIINTVINVVKDETSLLENTEVYSELFDNLKVLTEDENFDWEAESLEEINNEAEMLSKEIYESFINLEEEDFRDFLEKCNRSIFRFGFNRVRRSFNYTIS